MNDDPKWGAKWDQSQGGDEPVYSEPDAEPSTADLAERFESNSFTEDQLGTLPATKPLIGGVLDEDTLSVVHGAPKSGKSFLALSWAMSVVTGTWWLSTHAVEPSTVIYVAAEGSRGFQSRIRAWRSHNNVTTIGDLHVVRRSVKLMQPVDVQAFIAYAQKRAPKMIVIDTLARCIVGADENSAKDMGQVIDHLEDIRRATGAAVVAVHHSGRSGTSMRGSSALDGAVDMAYSLVKDADSVTLDRNMAKDHPDGIKWRLSLIPVGGSKAIDRFRVQADDEAPEDVWTLLRVLDDIDPNRHGVSKSDWEKASPASIDERIFRRYIGWLTRANVYVEEIKKGNSTKYRITDVGLASLAAGASQLPLGEEDHDLGEPF